MEWIEVKSKGAADSSSGCVLAAWSKDVVEDKLAKEPQKGFFEGRTS